jgi:hypothetical protein
VIEPPGRGDYEAWPCTGHPMDPRSCMDYLNDELEEEENDETDD